MEDNKKYVESGIMRMYHELERARAAALVAHEEPSGV